MNFSRFRQFIPIFIALVLFCLAISVIYQELKNYNLQEIVNSFTRISLEKKLEAIALTALGYLSMAGYDWLGFIYAGRSLAIPKIIRTAFISYALGNTIGLTIFSGTAIRYRFYAPAGVSNFDIAKVIIFTHLSFWVGVLAIAGTVFLFDPLTIPHLLDLPFKTVRPLGIIFLLFLVAYLAASLWYKKSIRIWGESFSLPSPNLSLALIGVAIIDWGLATGVLYLLLPSTYHLSYFKFFGIYIFAMTAGMISTVPGGLGVFETVMLFLRPDSVSSLEMVGALLAYRVVYYFLPLIVAVVLLIGYEVQKRYHRD